MSKLTRRSFFKRVTLLATLVFTGGLWKVLPEPSKKLPDGMWRNTIDTAQDLTEKSLNQAIIDMKRFRDDKGVRLSIKPRFLVISPEAYRRYTRPISRLLSI